ncbi:MAG: hypothetical protein PSN34_12940 [Urechidicola sp.]|nr:hypothetical protein [Urechidicola sp.]
MKFKITIILICFFFTKGISQESIFFFKKDTIFITYDLSKLDTNICKEYTNLTNSKTKKSIGVRTTYNLLSNAEIKRKREQLKYIKEQYEIGRGSTAGLSDYFGLYFIHVTTIRKAKLSDMKKDPVYKMMKNHHLTKDTITHQDSLAFDKSLFYNVFRRYKSANTSLLLSEKELKNKRVIHFDGSKKLYGKIKEFSKKSIYIYMLEKKIDKKVVVKLGEKSNQKENDIYYIFNEVSLKRLPRDYINTTINDDGTSEENNCN